MLVCSILLCLVQDVQQGSAQIQHPDSTTTLIEQGSHKLILNWNSFNIPEGHLVRFSQPSNTSVALNRVVGSDPSVILGSLQANGQVWLLNPNGILFGASARVDVGALVASTLSIADDEFMAGNLKLLQDPSKSLSFVVNRGEIEAESVLLAAPIVENAGSIRAERIYLTAGREVMLDAGLFQVSLGQANEKGTVVLKSGAASDVMKQVVNTAGLVEAGSVIEENGVVKLVGAEGVAINHGTISANGRADMNAGAIRIESTQATVTTPASVIQADGVGMNSDGGTIHVLSLRNTFFGGLLSARGGETGDGGFIETSAFENIYIAGIVDTRALNGTTGMYLLDPPALAIIDGAGPGDLDGSLPTILSGTAGNTVSETALEGIAAATNVTLEATDTITVNNLADNILNMTTSAGFTFTLRTLNNAAGGITFLDTADVIQLAGGNIVIQSAFDASLGRLTTSGAGTITVSAGRTLDIRGTVTAVTGAVNLSTTDGDITLYASVITSNGGAASGAITITAGGTGSILDDSLQTTYLQATAAINLTAGNNIGTLSNVLDTTFCNGWVDFYWDPAWAGTMFLTATAANDCLLSQVRVLASNFFSGSFVSMDSTSNTGTATQGLANLAGAAATASFYIDSAVDWNGVNDKLVFVGQANMHIVAASVISTTAVGTDSIRLFCAGSFYDIVGGGGSISAPMAGGRITIVSDSPIGVSNGVGMVSLELAGTTLSADELVVLSNGHDGLNRGIRLNSINVNKLQASHGHSGFTGQPETVVITDTAGGLTISDLTGSGYGVRSLRATAGVASVSITTTGDLTLEADVSTAAGNTITLTASANIWDDGVQTTEITTTGTINLNATGNIGLEGGAGTNYHNPYVDVASGFTTLNINSGAAPFFVSQVGGATVALSTSQLGTLVSGGFRQSIANLVGDLNVNDNQFSANNNDIALSARDNINVTVANNVTTTTGTITFRAGGGINMNSAGSIQSATDVILIADSGQFQTVAGADLASDGVGAINQTAGSLSATNLQLVSGSGTNLTSINFSNLQATNSTSGSISVVDTAGGLTLTSLGGGYAVRNQSTGVGDGIVITATGNLVAGHDVSTAGSNRVTLTSLGGSISRTGGTITSSETVLIADNGISHSNLAVSFLQADNLTANNINLTNSQALTISNLNAGGYGIRNVGAGTITVATTGGSLTLNHDVQTGTGSIDLTAGGTGSILDDGLQTTRILTDGAITLTAAGGSIGALGPDDSTFFNGWVDVEDPAAGAIMTLTASASGHVLISRVGPGGSWSTSNVTIDSTGSAQTQGLAYLNGDLLLNDDEFAPGGAAINDNVILGSSPGDVRFQLGSDVLTSADSIKVYAAGIILDDAAGTVLQTSAAGRIDLRADSPFFPGGSDGAGSITLDNAGLDLITNNLVLTASEGILVTNSTIGLLQADNGTTAGAITVTDGAGGLTISLIDATVSAFGVRNQFAGGGGTVSVTTTGDLTLSADIAAAGGNSITLTANGAGSIVDDGDQTTDIATTGTIVLTAASNVGGAAINNYIDLAPGFTGLSSSVPGSIYVAQVGTAGLSLSTVTTLTVNSTGVGQTIALVNMGGALTIDSAGFGAADDSILLGASTDLSVSANIVTTGANLTLNADGNVSQTAGTVSSATRIDVEADSAFWGSDGTGLISKVGGTLTTISLFASAGSGISFDGFDVTNFSAFNSTSGNITAVDTDTLILAQYGANDFAVRNASGVGSISVSTTAGNLTMNHSVYTGSNATPGSGAITITAGGAGSILDDSNESTWVRTSGAMTFNALGGSIGQLGVAGPNYFDPWIDIRYGTAAATLSATAAGNILFTRHLGTAHWTTSEITTLNSTGVGSWVGLNRDVTATGGLNVNSNLFTGIDDNIILGAEVDLVWSGGFDITTTANTILLFAGDDIADLAAGTVISTAPGGRVELHAYSANYAAKPDANAAINLQLGTSIVTGDLIMTANQAILGGTVTVDRLQAINTDGPSVTRWEITVTDTAGGLTIAAIDPTLSSYGVNNLIDGSATGAFVNIVTTGNLIVNAPVQAATSNPVTLVANGGSIYLNANVSTTTGDITMTAGNSIRDDGTETTYVRTGAPGIITLTATNGSVGQVAWAGVNPSPLGYIDVYPGAGSISATGGRGAFVSIVDVGVPTAVTTSSIAVLNATAVEDGTFYRRVGLNNVSGTLTVNSALFGASDDRIYLSASGSITIDSAIDTTGQNIVITSTGGNVDFNANVLSGFAGNIVVSAGGSITDDGNSATRVGTASGVIRMTATGTIGTLGDPIHVRDDYGTVQMLPGTPPSVWTAVP